MLTWSDIWWPLNPLSLEADVKRLILMYNLQTYNKEGMWPFPWIFDLKWTLMTSRPNLTSRANLTFFLDFRPQVNSDALWPIISGNCRQERHLFIFHLPSSIERKFRPFLRSKASFWFKFLLAFEEFEIWTSHLMTPGPFFERLNSRASFWYRIV